VSYIFPLQTLVIVCSTIVFVTSVRFLRRYLELKHENRVPTSMEGLSERLERIEQIVEMTAADVERISEANRFISKLLADRGGPPNAATRPERVITPH
jgi:hypothetical protein